jgi:hypothetical protein
VEIKDFVKQVLLQVADATQEASQESKDEDFYLDSSSSKGVHFDLAVITTQSTDKSAEVSGGGKIIVASIEGTGTISKQDSSQVTSRIQFNVKHNSRKQIQEAINYSSTDLMPGL